jgi:hypothetical protein
MEVDTGQFAAICDRVDDLEAAVAELRRGAGLREVLADAIEARGYQAGRASILGGPVDEALRHSFDAGVAYAREGTTLRPPVRRPRHLRAVDGGAS